MDAEVLRAAVRLASRAPSLHNSQPWQWVAHGRELELHLDRNRILPGTDAGGRQALIGCGAALDHLRVAMAAADLRCHIDRFPDRDHRTLLATVRFTHEDGIFAEHRGHADAILARRTDRLPFAAILRWDDVEPQLRAVVRSTDESASVRLDVVDDRLRPELVAASVLTEALRRYDSAYHAELDWWTASFGTAEGVPHSALTSAEESDRVDVNRAFPVAGRGVRRSAISTDHATVLVLSTPADGNQDALRCGEVLSAVLLSCTAAGLATCPVTHVTEFGPARAVVAELLSRPGHPQVLIRVGRAPELGETPPPTPRRALTDVLRFADTASALGGELGDRGVTGQGAAGEEVRAAATHDHHQHRTQQ